MPEWHILLVHNFGPQLVEKLLAVVVLFLGVDVVRADQVELLAELLDQPGNELVLLLVGHGAGVDHVLRALAPLVEGRVPVEIVPLLEDR